MLYSFIKPRTKPFISSEIRAFLIFFAVVSIMLSSLYAFFLYQNSALKLEERTLKVEYEEIKEQNEMLQDDIVFIGNQVSFTENIRTENTILKEQIKNLFDLIPNEIILKKVSFSSKDLLIKGETVDKSSFVDKLQIPLSSMFYETTVKYRELANKKLYFTSHSTIEKESKP